jgi:DNA repair exonuclease SbcCD nuclease subunit
MRFLHTADWQLGMTRHFLGAAAQARFTDDRLAAVRDALEFARREGCAFVVVGGDVFETNQVDRQTVVRALDVLAAAKVPIFLLPGNHDPFDAGSVWRQRTFRERKPTNVTVIDSAKPIEAAPGVEVVGAPWQTKRPLEDLVAVACRNLAPSKDALRVMVGHGCVDTLSPDREDAAAISLASAEAAIREGRIHYLALGDRHSLTDVGATGRVRYAGAPEATDYDETAPSHVLVVDLNADSCRVTPHRVGRWTFLLHEADLAGDADVDQVEAYLGALTEKDRTIVKLALRGALTLRQQARLDDVLAHARDLLGALEVWERHTDLVVRPDDDDFADLGLSGFAHTASDRLRALASADGAEAVAARDALGLLVRLARSAE